VPPLIEPPDGEAEIQNEHGSLGINALIEIHCRPGCIGNNPDVKTAPILMSIENNADDGENS
jgi:hypothetical protein